MFKGVLAVLMVDHYPPCVNAKKKSEIIQEKGAIDLKSKAGLHLLPKQVLHEPIKNQDIYQILIHVCHIGVFACIQYIN